MFEDWYVHPVTVTPMTSTSPYGGAQEYGTPVPLLGWVEEAVKLTRNAGGNEVTSTVTVHLPLEAAQHVKAGSLVALPASQHPDTTVISVSTTDSRTGDELDGVTVMCE